MLYFFTLIYPNHIIVHNILIIYNVILVYYNLFIPIVSLISLSYNILYFIQTNI